MVIQEIRTYKIIEKECKLNSDLCFCKGGECSVKYNCQLDYNKLTSIDGIITNKEVIEGTCKDLDKRLCEI